MAEIRGDRATAGRAWHARPWRRAFLFVLVTTVACALGATFLGPASGTEEEVAPAASEIVVRKNVRDLTAEEKADFVEAIWRLRRTPSPHGTEVGNWYDYFVATHMAKLICWTDEPGQGGYGHNGPDITTWHRAYLRDFETALSTVMGKPMAIPYWDSTDPKSTTVVFAEDFMGPAGDPDNGYVVTSGPFRQGQWRINVKGPGSTNPGQSDWLVRAIKDMSDMAGLPLAAEVEQALLRPVYDVAPWGVKSDTDTSFRAFVDGTIGATGTPCEGNAITMTGVTGTLLHSTVHMWVGGMTDEGNPGSMADTVTSPNDPIFWLHHSNIDRLAETWWRVHDYEFLPRTTGPRGTNLGDMIWPYEITNGDLATTSGILRVHIR